MTRNFEEMEQHARETLWVEYPSESADSSYWRQQMQSMFVTHYKSESELPNPPKRIGLFRRETHAWVDTGLPSEHTIGGFEQFVAVKQFRWWQFWKWKKPKWRWVRWSLAPIIKSINYIEFARLASVTPDIPDRQIPYYDETPK